jgi:cytochrome c-type biogenesis protein CcmH
MKRALSILLLCVLAAVASDAQTRSQEEVSREALKLFNTIMSPYCPGALLADCMSSKAGVLRDKIRADLARGRDPEEIVDELIVDYGQQVLGAPPLEGAGIAAWVLPILVPVAGLWYIYSWLGQRRVVVAEQTAKPVHEQDERLREKMRAELEQYK